jgi:hypothetical protein
MYLDPPLEPSEVDFLSGFSSRGDIRRVWPGQPNAHCPWRVAPDGTSLDLDAELADQDPEQVTPWLRFLCHAFLAPSSIEAMHAALAHRLRGGHQMTGTVLVGDREISAVRNRISERIVEPEHDALVLPFGGPRGSGGGSPSGSPLRRHRVER